MSIFSSFLQNVVNRQLIHVTNKNTTCLVLKHLTSYKKTGPLCVTHETCNVFPISQPPNTDKESLTFVVHYYFSDCFEMYHPLRKITVTCALKC